MFDRENAIGFLLLGLCVVVGGVMLFSIVTGTELEYTGPGWVGVVLFVVFIGAIGFGLLRGRIGGRRFGQGPQWPDPRAGSRPWWRRFFGGDRT